MPFKNINYQSATIAEFYATNRVTWDSLYPSEKAVVEQVGINRDDSVLDIGCGCGGLALALAEKYGPVIYTGVDINEAAVIAGKSLVPEATMLYGDVLEVSNRVIAEKQYRLVFSLSCVDWNVQFEEMLSTAWSHVEPGGYLIATFRLCAGPSISDIEKSFQYVNFDGLQHGEKAPYVVLNLADLLTRLRALNPAKIIANGYWGTPSKSARTPYESLCFSAFGIRKPKLELEREFTQDLVLPADLLEFRE